MGINVEVRRIFVASPGGLDEERNVIKEAIEQFNRSRLYGSAIQFSVVEWQHSGRGAMNAQGKINDLIRDSDYMLVLFHDRWGIPPSTDGRYSSGTEEEFNLGLELISVIERPMRNVCVFFKSVETGRLAALELDSQLRAVIEFRAALEATKQHFHGQFDDHLALYQRVLVQLDEWARDSGIKETKEYDPVLVSFANSSISTEVGAEQGGAALQSAIEAAERGLTTRADVLFARALSTEGAQAVFEYAKFLRRQGRLSAAVEKAELLHLEGVGAGNGNSPELLWEIKALAEIAVVERKMGKALASETRLREALKIFPEPIPEEFEETWAYVSDNLAVTLTSIGSYEEAAEWIRRSIALRERRGEAEGLARSHANLARTLNRSGKILEAAGLLESFLRQSSPDLSARARADLLAEYGHALMSLDRLDDASKALLEADELNRDVGNREGEGVAAARLARLFIKTGDFAKALAMADRCQNLASASGNVDGLAQGTWLLGIARHHLGEHSASVIALKEAVRIAEVKGRLNLRRAFQREAEALGIGI
ncbi:DUF4062 domain-containing protein [Microcella alkaliphila]|uniref:DUF4062 domain-containing protein n=1 Tax=Microcella alkaliphila TaxID=279828 RepID=UPI00123728F4|nr:DUF4062 domain-containing protein [Microcella alkaliphila]